MHRYLPGIFVVQLVTAILLWVNLDAAPRDLAIQFGIPALLICLVTALWFASISRADSERANAKIRLEHARDREKLHVNAEKTKAKIIEKTHKEIRKQEKRIGRKASLKVSLAFFGAIVAGIVMLITELVTFGLMTIMTTAGGLGGYLLRARQSYDANNSTGKQSSSLIDADETFAELPAPPKSPPTE